LLTEDQSNCKQFFFQTKLQPESSISFFRYGQPASSMFFFSSLELKVDFFFRYGQPASSMFFFSSLELKVVFFPDKPAT